MAFNKKTSRKIVVGDQEYLWKIARHRRNDLSFLDLLVELEDAGGATLMQPFQTYATDFLAPKITPADTRKAIEKALESGWKPDKVGPQWKLKPIMLPEFSWSDLPEVSTSKSPGHTLLHTFLTLLNLADGNEEYVEETCTFIDARKKKYFSELLLYDFDSLSLPEQTGLVKFREHAEVWMKSWKKEYKKREVDDLVDAFLSNILATIPRNPAETAASPKGAPEVSPLEGIAGWMDFFRWFLQTPKAQLPEALEPEAQRLYNLLENQFEEFFLISGITGYRADKGLLAINRKEGTMGFIQLAAI